MVGTTSMDSQLLAILIEWLLRSVAVKLVVWWLVISARRIGTDFLKTLSSFEQSPSSPPADPTGTPEGSVYLLSRSSRITCSCFI